MKGSKKGIEKPRLPYAKNVHFVQIRKKQCFICFVAFFFLSRYTLMYPNSLLPPVYRRIGRMRKGNISELGAGAKEHQ